MVGKCKFPELKKIEYAYGWITYDANNDQHTLGIIPSAVFRSGDIQWVRHGSFHNEHGPDMILPDINERTWNLHNEELEGRVLLW